MVRKLYPVGELVSVGDKECGCAAAYPGPTTLRNAQGLRVHLDPSKPVVGCLLTDHVEGIRTYQYIMVVIWASLT